MISHLRITVLMEHRTIREDLATEHGFSLWIEADGTRILFDTGQSDAFAGNARRLGVDLSAADFIVLSHGHYDHTGGLEAALEAAPRAQVCFHPEAGMPRFSHPPGLPVRHIGMPASAWKALRHRVPEARLCSGPLRLVEGIWATGPIPRIHAVEHPQKAFTLDESGIVPDPFRDDQSLVLESPSGKVILTGCCHAGVANTLLHAQSITGDTRTPLLIGGLHLVRSSEAQMEGVRTILLRAGVHSLWAGHCTGAEAENILGSPRREGGPGPLKGLLEAGASWDVDLQAAQALTHS
jgi:7,8-dihydropterin-6-yl-methyl-4-(beta-D-ribofuranosyl)aminobenzene 5'-phosphate synthase